MLSASASLMFICDFDTERRAFLFADHARRVQDRVTQNPLTGGPVVVRAAEDVLDELGDPESTAAGEGYEEPVLEF